MNQKTEEEIYKEYISQKQECPVCGGCMGCITAWSFASVSSSSTAISLVVCLLQPEGAASPASIISFKCSLGTFVLK